MTMTPDRKPHPDTSVNRPRVGVLTTDRFCTGCGYNLIGQAIVHDEPSGLRMVLCSECGVAAPFHSYPMLRRPTWMLRHIAIGSWLIFVVLGAIVTCGGLASSFVMTSSPYAQAAGDGTANAFYEHLETEYGFSGLSSEEQSALLRPSVTSRGLYYDYYVNGGFLESARNAAAALVRSQSYWLTVTGAMVIALASGVLLSVVFPLRGTRARLLTMVLALLATMSLFTWLQSTEFAGTGSVRFFWLNQNDLDVPATLLHAMLFSRLVVVPIALIACFAVGSLMGRRLLRCVVLWSFPQSMHPHFGLLWTVDNLPLPRPSALPSKASSEHAA